MKAGWFNFTWLLVLILGCAGCRSVLGPPPECPGDPDAAVMELRRDWQRAPYVGLYEGTDCGDCESDVKPKALIRRETENLLYRFPRHVPTRLFAALLAYEADDPVRAVEHLDTLLELQPVHPEAAVLRARIALESGNIPFAKTFLREQVALRPNDPALHEALSSAHFMDDNLDDALASLDVADRLGAPQWRVAYNRGVIEEARGNSQVAAGHYKSSLSLMPHWSPPRARLEALEKGLVTDTQVMGFPPAGVR